MPEHLDEADHGQLVDVSDELRALRPQAVAAEAEDVEVRSAPEPQVADELRGVQVSRRLSGRHQQAHARAGSHAPQYRGSD